MPLPLERALLELEKVSGDLLHPLGNGVPVYRAQRHDLEDQHIEGSLEDFHFLFGHKRIPSSSTYTYTARAPEC